MLVSVIVQTAYNLLSLLSVAVRFSLRVISCEEGKALAESWNAAFMESSAKENQVRTHDHLLM